MNNETLSKLINLISSVNTALILDNHLTNNDKPVFTFSLKYNQQNGYVFLDVISDVKHIISQSFKVNKTAVLTMRHLETEILGTPDSVAYTVERSGNNSYSLNVVRSYLIKDGDYWNQVSRIKEMYEAHNCKLLNEHNEPHYDILYFLNNRAPEDTRHTTFKAMAASMVRNNDLSLFLNELVLGNHSYVVPHFDANDTVDKVIVETGNLRSERCSNISVKVINVPHEKNDKLFARNHEYDIDMTIPSHGTYILNRDYYKAILNNPKPSLLSEIYSELTEI